MKFSLVAILPAVLWTVFYLAVLQPSSSYRPGTWPDILLFLVYSLTAAVLALYWGARVVRFALRSPRAR